MAYQIGRAKRLEEVLELVDNTGLVVHSIPVDLDVDKIAIEFNRRYNTVVKAERLVRALPSGDSVRMTEAEANKANEALASFGEAVCSLFELVFGEDGCAKIIEFYDGKYFELTLEVLPFLTEVVIPKMKKATSDTQERLASNYKISQAAKLNRAQRRKFGLY